MIILDMFQCKIICILSVFLEKLQKYIFLGLRPLQHLQISKFDPKNRQVGQMVKNIFFAENENIVLGPSLERFCNFFCSWKRVYFKH